MNPILDPLGNNKILDPLGITPPMAWEQQQKQTPVVEPKPTPPATGFHWDFLYTEAILAFAFVAIVGWVCRNRDAGNVKG